MAEALDSDRRTRVRLILTIALIGVILGVFALWGGDEHESSQPGVITHGPDYDKPVGSHSVEATENNPYRQSDNLPSEQHEATASPVGPLDNSKDHELREDGRVYSVSLIVATPHIPVGSKLFAQGRIASFGYASGMRSRPFAVIADEQQPSKTLLCAMMGEDGIEVVSLYRVGEVVAVSGEYMVTASLAGYPPMPILSDCQVAGPQNIVVRPAPSRVETLAKSDDIKVVADIMRIQVEEGKLEVVRMFVVDTSESATDQLNEGRNFEFYIPDGAKIVGSKIFTNGQNIDSSPVSLREKNRYSFRSHDRGPHACCSEGWGVGRGEHPSGSYAIRMWPRRCPTTSSQLEPT